MVYLRGCFLRRSVLGVLFAAMFLQRRLATDQQAFRQEAASIQAVLEERLAARSQEIASLLERLEKSQQERMRTEQA